MCLFPLPNYQINSVAYRKGVTEFDCGACPECLRKRSNVWALRCYYESLFHAHSCMVTLTYDRFKRDDRGNRIGNEELPVDSTLTVNKRHIQLFIKRLRKKFGSGIKYLCGAEYGSRTHRAHYHLILFGVDFPDRHYYKKSKRGNTIYMSSTLTSLWGHGICTVDSVTIKPSIAAYCTKYCAKTRSSDTFMLTSQHIGYDGLIRDFNGLFYIIEGHRYPIPRFVWEHYIMSRYSSIYPDIDYHYVNRRRDISDFDEDPAYDSGVVRRFLYRAVRDQDFVYRRYLEYWHTLGDTFQQRLLSPRERILLLPDEKFHSYKQLALRAAFCRRVGVPVVAPGSKCVSAHYRYLESLGLPFSDTVTCPISSRHNRASDTTSIELDPFNFTPVRKFKEIRPLDVKYFKLGLTKYNPLL